MPTLNPRLTITLQPALAAQLRRLSQLTGNSQSALIAELLDGSGQVFARLIQVLEAAEGAKAAMKGKIADDLEAAQTKMEMQLGLALDTFGDVTGDLLREAETVKRRAGRVGQAGRRTRPARPLVASATPLSNRGVRSTTKQAKTGGK